MTEPNISSAAVGHSLSGPEERHSEDGLNDLDSDVVQQVLSSGVNFNQYALNVENELKTVERSAVADYIREAEHIAGLHQEITACDNVLECIEQMLETFQCDLGKISCDIQSLQEQSSQIDVQLGNKKEVRAQLSQFVDDIIISKQMIEVIMDVHPSDRHFLEVLHELQHKIQFIRNQQFKEVKATQDVCQVADTLKLKAIEKTRHFLLERIYQLRKPLANFQVPQNQLLKYRFYYEFLLGNDRTVAGEVRDEFVDTLSKVFYSYFKTYTGRLIKLQHCDVATAADVLAAEDTVRSSSLFGSRPAVRNRATVYSLGARIQVLSATDNEHGIHAPIIVPHVASDNAQKFQFESVLRSVQFALAEHACHEYLFVTDFFMLDSQAAADLFMLIMGKAIQIVHKVCEDQIAVNYDCIALLLCIHLCDKYKLMMQNRDINVLEQHWRDVLASLWSRLEQVMRLHIDSVHNADVGRLIEHAKDSPTSPHYIVRRYAELSSALLAIALTQAPIDARLETLSTRLDNAIEQLLMRMVTRLRNGPPSKHKTNVQSQTMNKQQLILLINNYDLVLNVFTERLTEERREATFARELLTKYTTSFVEEVLFPHFGAIMHFVTDCEPEIAQGHTETLRRYTQKVPNLVRSFSDSWRQSIEDINKEIMQSFTNFKNGTQILQTALTQLVQYYHRFQKVLQNAAFSECTARNELVNIHTIMVELKKYKPVF